MKRLLSSILICVSLTLQAQHITLVFNPAEGAEYPISLTVNQYTTLRVPMMGDMTTQTDQEFKAVLTLDEKTEQGYLMDVRLTHLYIRSSAQGQSQEYDSEGEDVKSQAIKSVMAQSFKVVASSLGEVVEVLPLPEDFFHTADSILATQYARRKRNATLDEIKAILNTQTIKSIVQAGLTKFPDKTLAVPSVWTEDDKNEEMGVLVTTQLRLTAVEEGKAYLTAQAVVMPDPNAKKKDAPQRMENITGNGQAATTVDIDSGWVIVSEGTQNLKGDLVVEQGGMVQTIDLAMEIKTTVVATESKP